MKGQTLLLKVWVGLRTLLLKVSLIGKNLAVEVFVESEFYYGKLSK
jgi:hypothetical protein